MQFEAILERDLGTHSRWVHDCCWSAGDGLCVSAGFDCRALVHRVDGAAAATAEPVVVLKHSARVRACCCAGTAVVTGCKTSVHVWDAVSGGTRSVLAAPAGSVGEFEACVAFGDAMFAAAGTRPRGCPTAEVPVLLYDTRAAAHVGSLVGHTSGVTRLCCDPAGQLLASASTDGSVRVWEARAGGRALHVLGGHKGGVRSCAFWAAPGDDAAAAEVVSGGYDRAILVHQLRPRAGVDSGTGVGAGAGAAIGRLAGYCFSLACSSAFGGVVAAGAGNPDYAARLWTLGRGDEEGGAAAQEGGAGRGLCLVQELPGNKEHASCCAFSSCGRRLLTGGEGGVLRLWQLRETAVKRRRISLRGSGDNT